MASSQGSGSEVGAARRAAATTSGAATRTPRGDTAGVPPTPPAGEKRTVRIQWAPAAAPRIRKALVEDLLARELPAEVVDEAEIVVSELVANAIRHAKPLADGAIRIHWKVKNNVVEVEVSDGGGPTVPRPAPPTTWAPGGRGLRIVRSLAHEWGVIEESHGRTVWASLGGPSRRRSH